MITIRCETPSDIAMREAILDAALGQNRLKKASEKLRRNRLPAEKLSFVAHKANGQLAGTVRLWHVMAGAKPALLLGPLAVDTAHHGAGIGSMLMQAAIAEARILGHGAILLVGDEPYYQRFGFSGVHTGHLVMPAPVDPARFLALELEKDALSGAVGAVMAAGRLAPRKLTSSIQKAA